MILARQLGAAFLAIHRAIVRAKLRRFRQEPMLRRGFDVLHSADQDASKYPWQPLVFGDKWDF
jgi:hypothetical protein